MKALANYLHKREAAIHAILKKPRRKYSAGTFHKLRVEIKKLNALLKLISFSAKELDREKTFKPIKKVFRQAGKVREIQVEEKMLKKYLPENSLKRYRKMLKKRRLKVQKAYFKTVNKKVKDRLKKSFQKIKPHLKTVNKPKAKTYLNKNKSSIQGLLDQQKLEVPQIHDLRKQLKVFNYNSQSLHLKGKHTQEVVLSELLGEWHDCQVIISHLEKTISNEEIKPEEKSQLEDLKAEIISKSEKLLAEINKSLAASNLFEANHKASNAALPLKVVIPSENDR